MPTSLGPAEIMVILVVALIVLGPKRLPEAGRQVGKAIAEVRRWSQGFQDEIKSVIEPDAKAPSYADPQPGYTPAPLPVIPSETPPPPPDEGATLPADPAASADPAAGAGEASNTVTTGSHGLVSGPAPATDPNGHIDASLYYNPYDPPAGESPPT